MTSLAEGLPEQIIRVMALRDRWVGAGMKQAPEAQRLTADLHRAIRASSHANIVETLAAHHALTLWTEEGRAGG